MPMVHTIDRRNIPAQNTRRPYRSRTTRRLPGKEEIHANRDRIQRGADSRLIALAGPAGNRSPDLRGPTAGGVQRCQAVVLHGPSSHSVRFVAPNHKEPGERYVSGLR